MARESAPPALRAPGARLLTGIAAGSLAAALALGALPAAAADGETWTLWRENRRLAAEVELAKSPKSYFVFDLGGRRVALRARGMTLAEWPLVDAVLWGRRLPIAPTTLERKDALQRPAIVPGEGQSLEKLDAQILEVTDMPTTYGFGLEGGLEVRVLPAPAGGVLGRLRNAARVLGWRLTRPLKTLADRSRRRETASLLLVLAPDDARAVYWSFYEGIRGVVVPP